MAGLLGAGRLAGCWVNTLWLTRVGMHGVGTTSCELRPSTGTLPKKNAAPTSVTRMKVVRMMLNPELLWSQSVTSYQICGAEAMRAQSYWVAHAHVAKKP